MLKALGELQQRREIELLEWRPAEQTLYILEPSFLFYIRWRELRAVRNYDTDLQTVLDQLVKETQRITIYLHETVHKIGVKNVSSIGVESLGNIITETIKK